MKIIEHMDGAGPYVYCTDCGLSSSIEQLGLDAWACLCVHE